MPRVLGQLPVVGPASHSLQLHRARQGGGQVGVKRVRTVDPKGNAAVGIGGLLGILLGGGGQGVVLDHGVGRKLGAGFGSGKDAALQGVFFFRLLGLHGGACSF